MSFNGILEIENEKYRVINWNVNIKQQVDHTGRPNANPGGGLIRITVESSDSSDLMEWAVSPDMTKNGRIVFQRRDNSSSLRTFDFREAYCVEYNESFSSEGTNPMLIIITLSSQSLKSGSAELSKNWNKLN
ncbi:MAG: hypothetical protein MI892_24545 [Desulfobacterales bacterium]|nr:hypothetical protein [Desulfobacterales bacterium]